MRETQIQLTSRENNALKVIRGWFLKYGRGISVRELTREMGFGSTRTAALLLNGLISKGILERRPDGGLRIVRDPVESKMNARVVDVPLVGTVACGAPIFAEENIETHIPVSLSLAKPGYRYFLLRATGDSMNEAGINDGDLVLIRQQSTADSGQRVVALIDDEATLKEIKFVNDAVILMPRSKNKAHKPIVLNRDFLVQGVVVAILPADMIEH